MITQTTVTAIRMLVYLGANPAETLLSIRRIAGHLGESPAYLAKVVRQLVKAGILKAYRGTMGGVELNRSPRAIPLLSIVEACQGAIPAGFCRETPSLAGTCAFHVAMVELQKNVNQTLDRWTLEQLLKEPRYSQRPGAVSCLLQPRPPRGGRAVPSPRRRSAVKAAAGRTRLRFQG